MIYIDFFFKINKIEKSEYVIVVFCELFEERVI